jgi:hypothetical protein
MNVAPLTYSITELEESLHIKEHNEPIRRREGNIEQADFDLKIASDFRKALEILRAARDAFSIEDLDDPASDERRHEPS